MFGKPCCRKRVGAVHAGIAFGFGAQVFHNDARLIDSFYGEWEIRNYYRAWRVIQNGRILYGCHDFMAVNELNAAINQIAFGNIISLEKIADFDIRMQLDNDISVDFLATTTDEESLVIFGPNELCVEYSASDGWTASDASIEGSQHRTDSKQN